MVAAACCALALAHAHARAQARVLACVLALALPSSSYGPPPSGKRLHCFAGPLASPFVPPGWRLQLQ